MGPDPRHLLFGARLAAWLRITCVLPTGGLFETWAAYLSLRRALGVHPDSVDKRPHHSHKQTHDRTGNHYAPLPPTARRAAAMKSG